MAEQHTMHAVFVRGNDQPVAVFADADQAARYRRDTHGDQAVVVPVEGVDLSGAARAAAEALPDEASAGAAAPGTTADPDAVLRGEIRAKLVEEQHRARIEAEVKGELDAEQRSRPATTTEPGAPRQVPRVEAARTQRA